MEILFLLGGVILGSLIMRFILLRKTAYGIFILDPSDDPDNPEKYTVVVGIRQGQPLLNKRQIILKRDNSLKQQVLL